MVFKAGLSGNPKGRPRGSTNQAKLRKTIEEDLPEILGALVEAAKSGNPAAAKLLIDRVMPALKPVDLPVDLPLGEGLSEDGHSILSAVGSGQITPDEAGKLFQGLGALARVEEIAEIKGRVEALERTLQDRGRPR